MKKWLSTSVILVFILFSSANLKAQDSLRLTFKLDGFKEKDQLSFSIEGNRYKLPTDKEEYTITKKLDSPITIPVFFKSKFKSVWVDDNDIVVYISKSKFPKGFVVEGSASQELWESIVSGSKEQRAQILEENINSKVAESFLAANSNSLLPEDRERLLAMTSSEINNYAKYNVSLLGLDTKGRLKENDQMMDFNASTIDGKMTNTKDLRGKYILLDFAGTGCGWCWVAYPKMAETLIEYRDLQVLTINNDFNFKAWQNLADKRDISLPWPVLWKAENKKEIFQNYGVNVLPTYLLVSPDGLILERWQGGKEEKIERILERHGVQ